MPRSGSKALELQLTKALWTGGAPQPVEWIELKLCEMYHCLPGPGSLADQDLETIIAHIRLSNVAARLAGGGGARSSGEVDPNVLKLAKRYGVDTSERTSSATKSGLGSASRSIRAR